MSFTSPLPRHPLQGDWDVGCYNCTYTTSFATPQNSLPVSIMPMDLHPVSTHAEGCSFAVACRIAQ